MRSLLVLLCACGLLAACSARQRGPSLPQLGEVKEFTIPWANAFPSDIAVDGDGRVWFTDRINHIIGRFDPATREFAVVETPTSRAAPYGIIAAPDGVLWFAESMAARIARLDPRTGEVTEYPVTGATRGGPHMLVWHDGLIWFTMREAAGYGKFDPRTGESTLYELPRSRPYSITATRDAIWFSSYESGMLYEVDPTTGSARPHDQRAPAIPRGLSSDSVRALNARNREYAFEVRRVTSDGAGIWFTDMRRGRVGRYDPATGQLRNIEALAPGAQPYGITYTRNGLVWFAENGANRIVVLDPVSEHRVSATMPTRGGTVRHIVVDEKRGRAWLPMSDRGILGLLEYR
ncbi:MAG TPA: hypothetical protein VK928_09855 [Longimicrobiales bacterium]|nr:hypothetical protein [Longimicrobiales bacterium]